MRIIIQILSNALAIAVADKLVPGIDFGGDILSYLIAGLVLGLINFFIKPVLKIISFPLIIISLGLFSLVINMFILWLLDWFIPELAIIGFWAYFGGAIVISAVNIFVSVSVKKDI